MAYFKINIESWESYNSGYLLGRWHDVSDLDSAELQDLLNSVQAEQAKQLNKLLKCSDSNCEELFAPDIETDLPIKYIESGISEMFEQFQALKDLLEHESEDTVKLAQAINESEGLDDLSEALEKAQGAYELDSDSPSDLAYAILDSTGQIEELPEFAQRYFNYASFGSDLILGGEYSIYNINGTAYAVSSY